MKKEKIWNPRAKYCAECNELKELKDEQTGTVDPNNGYCQKFKWIIPNELAKKQAVCRIEVPRRKRK